MPGVGFYYRQGELFKYFIANTMPTKNPMIRLFLSETSHCF
jgi:hypothetical protein